MICPCPLSCSCWFYITAEGVRGQGLGVRERKKNPDPFWSDAPEFIHGEARNSWVERAQPDTQSVYFSIPWL